MLTIKNLTADLMGEAIIEYLILEPIRILLTPWEY